MNIKIITVTEIALTMVFIVALVLIFSTVMRYTKESDTRLQNIEQIAIEAELQSYDNTVVSGDTVISTINKLKEAKNGIKMSYLVVDGSSTTRYGYQQLKGLYKETETTSTGTIEHEYADTEPLDPTQSYAKYTLTAHDSASAEFISPVAEYKSKLALTKNGALAGIVFTKV